MKSEIFPEKPFSDKIYIHDLEKLMVLAELKTKWDAAANASLDGNWGIVRTWKETSRYDQRTQMDAQALYDAITTNPDGVFPWIQLHW
jgi:hypothetical protein